MKKKLIIAVGGILFLFCVLEAGVLNAIIKPQEVNNETFRNGEFLEYRLHYGFVTAGIAQIDVNPKLFLVDDKLCYKFTVFGRTTGSCDFFMRIRDTWTSLVDTSNMIPIRASRIIEEGKYRKKESVFFDKNTKNAKVVVEGEQTKNCKIPEYIHDIVSGYYYLRNLDYTKMKVNDTIQVNAFFEDKVYDFKLKYLGKETIDTEYGKIKSLMISPIMPDNKLFDGENSIKLWMSGDENHIPLKCKASMFVGAVALDLINCKGLKRPLKIEKE